MIYLLFMIYVAYNVQGQCGIMGDMSLDGKGDRMLVAVVISASISFILCICICILVRSSSNMLHNMLKHTRTE